MLAGPQERELKPCLESLNGFGILTPWNSDSLGFEGLASNSPESRQAHPGGGAGRRAGCARRTRGASGPLGTKVREQR